MKKRSLIERRRALKEAYYNELRKAGVIDTPVVKTLEEMTKSELIEEGNKLGVELNEKQTKKEMISAIESFNNNVETEEVTEEEVTEEVTEEEVTEEVVTDIVEETTEE